MGDIWDSVYSRYLEMEFSQFVCGRYLKVKFSYFVCGPYLKVRDDKFHVRLSQSVCGHSLKVRGLAFCMRPISALESFCVPLSAGKRSRILYAAAHRIQRLHISIIFHFEGTAACRK
jgi:hypothetical protein